MQFVVGDWHLWFKTRDDAVIYPKLARLGAQGVEVGVYKEADLADERLEQLNALKKKHRLEIPIVSFFLHRHQWPKGALISDDQAVRSKVVAELKAIGRRAKKLGARTIGIWLGADLVQGYMDHPRRWKIYADHLRNAVEFLGELDLRLALEYKPGELIGNADSLMRMSDQLDLPNFGVLLDTGHALAQGEDLVQAVDKCQGRIFHVHIDDNSGGADDDLPPGQVHNFAPFFKALERAGFDGTVGLDIWYYLEHTGTDPEEAIKESKAYLDTMWPVPKKRVGKRARA
ncbi:MAG: sugar phosphate isomerase/epimerase [Deinococcus sp.]|nr:sugar phosphate isomerase/epimerase [Deinococcus sp.]